MSLATPLYSPRSLIRWRSRWLPMAAVMTVCALFMFVDLRMTPVVLWDEFRIAVNALEMRLSGHLSLVTTYGFQPDLWNTKPPLLIWLMDLSMAVFGASEPAMRLPTMAASLGTLALVMSFTRRVTQSFKAAALAAVLLALSLTFFGEHGARTADYDALLCFLTTGYLYLLFFTLHRRRPRAGAVMAAGVLVGLAVLTKSVAGLLPGVGVTLYVLLAGRWRRPLQSPWYAAAALLGAAGPAAFFVLREQAGPGYLKAALFNDVSGRFNSALDRHTGSPLYYLAGLFGGGGFSAGFPGAAAPLALVSARGRARLALLYCLCVAGGELAVLSSSATKLMHYAAPVLPFLAIMVAIAAREGLAVITRANREGRLGLVTPTSAKALLMLFVGVVAVQAIRARTGYLPEREFYPQALYGELFQALAAKGLTALQVVEGGIVKRSVIAEGVPGDYAPQFDFYRELANTHGMQVRRIAPAALQNPAAGALLASCDPDYTQRLRKLGPDLGGVKGCVAVRVAK